MNSSMPRIMRRSIGRVTIFDLLGDLSSEQTDAVQAYVEAYIKECHFQNIVVNLQMLHHSECSSLEKLMPVLLVPKKVAFYHTDQGIIDTCKYEKKKILPVCTSIPQMVDYFGNAFVEQEKTIHIDERRKSIRMKSALPAHVEFCDQKAVVHQAESIITNMSDQGLFVEFFDLHDTEFIENLDQFKSLALKVHMVHPNKKQPESMTRAGRILRIEFTGKQAGIAIHLQQ